jgi:2-dehydropantoate 2-reductase
MFGMFSATAPTRADTSASIRVGVLGAGLIGTFVGRGLAAAGTTVTLVGRARTLDPLANARLQLRDLDGATTWVSPEVMQRSSSVEVLSDCDVVLPCTKSAATRDAASKLDAVIPSHVSVISLQNGVENPRRIRDILGLTEATAG